MSGQTGPAPDRDEAARLEQALARISQAMARGARPVPTTPARPLLQAPASQARTAPGTPDTAHLAARLDSLILELRTLLGEQDV